jgi:outer membrane receptor for ferrienterochelin and colicin
VSLEYYFTAQGLLSVGAFRKKIQDYIETSRGNYVDVGNDNGYEGQYAGYEIITKMNSGEATIEGIEANYQQRLTFLPGWMQGLGVYGNFTKLRTHGTNSAFMTGPTSSAGGTIAGFLDVTGNVGVSYVGRGFDLRLQSNYRGKYMRSNNANPALVQWQLPKWSTSWKSRYNFTRNFGVFLDIENMFETPLDNAYAAYRDRIVQYRTFSLRIATGVTGRF